MTSAGAATPQPLLALERSASSLTVESYDGEVYADLGIYAVAQKKAVEIRARRTAYDKLLTGTLTKPTTTPLAKGLVTENFTGLASFYRLSITNAAGKKVVDATKTFCPNGYEQVRRRPDAPASSPYPTSCNGNPYSLGAVYGLQAGYATRLTDGDYEGLSLKPGTYTAVVQVSSAFKKLFAMTSAGSRASVKLIVVKGEDEEQARRSARAGSMDGSAAKQPSRAALSGQPRLTAAQAAATPLPDLRSLPAWGINVSDGRYLDFAATVWNAGPSRLVVDGFLQSRNRNLMDAFQYFFDAKGKQVGYAPVGTMEWDARDGHEHWHFTDFASYRLLDSNKKLVVRSQKEAFCLANTDAVDYLVAGANWNPDNTDLHTSCGDRSSLGVREVLETGSGDTYQQYLPGQSFDLKSLKNGTYYIQVLANPDHRLSERSTTNNASYRKVIIGGTAGKRTVTVPKVGVIVEPPIDEGEE